VSNESAENSDEPVKFTVDYIKSNLWRVIYAEGVWGCVTGSRNIHMAFWNSRDAIPRQITYEFDDEGEVEEVARDVRADQIRELDVGVLMSVEAAKSFREWLDEMIKEAEQQEVAEEEEAEEESPSEDDDDL